jgi:MYXO-CTERM domain-containing protein
MVANVTEPTARAPTTGRGRARRRPAFRAALAAAIACLVGAGHAAPVTFGFAGRVSDDAINGCAVLVACGLVSGRYSFDSGAADGNPDAGTGLYAASAISLSIDGAEFFSAANGVINVVDSAALEQYGLLALAGDAANGSKADLSILLQDTGAAAFGSDALPLTASALAALLPGSFTLFAGDDSFQLQGTIDSIECLRGCGEGEVPEPGTAWLAAAGLAALGLRRRRRAA